MQRARKMVLNPVKLTDSQVQNISNALKSLPIEERLAGTLIGSDDSIFELPPRSATKDVTPSSSIRSAKPDMLDLGIDFSIEKKKPENVPQVKNAEPVPEPSTKGKELDDWLDSLLG